MGFPFLRRFTESPPLAGLNSLRVLRCCQIALSNARLSNAANLEHVPGGREITDIPRLVPEINGWIGAEPQLGLDDRRHEQLGDRWAKICAAPAGTEPLVPSGPNGPPAKSSHAPLLQAAGGGPEPPALTNFIGQP